MNHEKRKGLAQLARVVIHTYELQAFFFFISLDELDVTVEDWYVVDSTHIEVVISMPHDFDPKVLVKRWKRWEKEELLYDYAMKN